MKQKLISFILAVLLALDPGFTVFAKMQDSQETAIAQEEDSGDLTDIAADSDLTDAAAEEEHEEGLELLEEPEYSSGISMAEDMIISSASESESYVSGNYTYTVTDGEATITAYTGSETDVVIPAQIDGINVVEIGDAAFAQNTAIQSVVISNGIKRLGHGIFDECTSLSSITFSKTLEWMGRWNFDGTAIEKIRLDQTSELELDAYAFAGADKLTQIELYGNTTVMSSSTFSSCNALDTVAIGANVSEKYGGDGGLHSCPNLRAITLSDNNTNYTLKDGVLYNEDMTKIFCYPAKKGGTEYIMPNTVEEVPSFTFWYNRYLEKIVFSTNLTTIGNYATSDNYCLSIVEIPASVTSIGNSAFTDLTIWGFKGSAAETYANRYDLAFVDIEEMKDSSGKESTSGSEDSDWNGSKTEAITPIGDTYVVKTAAQLAWIAQETANGNSFACKKILLDADIDLGGNEWTPIGNSNTHFMGSFDGQGHTISNLTVTGSSSKTLCGLFGAISAKHAGINVVIKDINLENVTISGGNYGGGLTGYARIYKGTNLVIEGCTVEGTLNGATVGGLVGRIAGGLSRSSVTVQDIECECDVTASGTGGGVIGVVEQYGYNYSYLGDSVGSVLINDCSNDGAIQGTGTYGAAGGILGGTSNTDRGTLYLEHCKTEGTVKSSSYVNLGGIVTSLSGGQNHIKQCVNYAAVTGGYNTGGIVGEVGVVGLDASKQAVVEQCYNEGYIRVTQTGCTLGGIAGKNNSVIKDCYNTGRIGGGDVVYNGGITGRNNGYLENCYNIGILPGRGLGTSYVSIPGAMSCHLGGNTSYCFFDKTQDEDAYLYGNMDTQDIITDSENNIEYSGGMFTAQMKNPASYIVWDFDNVWEFDSEYGYGYPILREIKDILKKHPDESESEMVYEQDEFRITVVDQDGEKLQGAIIVCGDVTMETGSDGSAIFDYESGSLKISVTKENYISYTDDDYRMNDTLENTIRLVSEDAVGDHALNSAVLWWHGNRYELLTQTKEINKKFQSENITLVCKALADTQEIDKFELYQGDELIDESPDGVFTLTPNDLIETKRSGKVYKTKIKVYLTDGTTCEEEINMDVVDEDTKVSQVEFGQNLTFTVGDDVPLFGGSTITFDTMELPVNVSISEDKWKVSLNILEKNMGEAAEIFKSELTATKKLTKLKNYLKEDKIEPAKNPSVKLEVVGYGEGDLPMEGNKITMQVYVQLVVSTSKEVQVYPGIVFAVEFRGTIKASGEIKWDDADCSLDGSIKLGGSAALSAYLGIGVAYVASAGVYGTGAFHINFYLLPLSKSGLDEMYLDADIKAVIRFMGSNAIECPVAGPWYGWIYSRDLNEYSARSFSSGRMDTMQMHLAELNDSEAEITAEAAASAFTGDQEILQETAYSQSSPVIMESGGDVIMLFTSNTLEDRAIEDASVLMYSVYDEASGTWGTPEPVWDDGTADFNPIAAGDYVVWNNSRTSLAECDTYSDLGAAQEVGIARYNSDIKAFEETENLTDNDVYENNLSIQDSEKGVVIAWTVNSEGNVFGVEGSNDIYLTSGEGVRWKTEQVAAVDGMVLSLEPGVFNNQYSCIYVVDENDNLTDGIGQMAYLVSQGEEAVKVSDMNVSYAWLSESQDKMIWIGADGSIYSSSDPAEEAVCEADAGLLPGNITQVLEDTDGNMTVFYIVSEDNCSNAYRISYDAASGAWSQPIAVTEQADYVESMSGAYCGDELILVYNQRAFDMESEDLNGVNSIRFMSMEHGNAVLSAPEVDFYVWDAAPGADLPLSVTVKNTGTTPCSGLQAVIRDDSTVYVNETLQEVILPGEEKEIELNFTLPTAVEMKEYTLELTPANGSTGEMVSSTFIVGESYYQIEKSNYCVGGKHMIVASVRNMGFESGSGTLEIYDNTGTGKVYETFDFEGMEYGQVLYYSTSIESLDWDSFEIKAIGMRVTKDGESASEPRTVTIFQEIEDLVVTSVSLNTTYVYLDEAGMQEQLSVKVNPTGVSGVNLVWESSDPTVASVDQNGLVTAKRPGDAIIRVSTEDGGCYSRCVVMVGGEDPGPGIVFEDVASYHFFYYPVLWAVEKGVTDGATDTTFAPDNSCTRGQVVTFLWRAAGKPQPTSTTCNFTDVAKGAYYYDAVLWAVEKGITDGTSDTTFSPDATCTRGQVVTFLWRSAGQPNATADVSAFTDVTAAAYYYNPVRWAVQYGITDGTSDTTFSPDATCTRGQVVTFLYRTYN